MKLRLYWLLAVASLAVLGWLLLESRDRELLESPVSSRPTHQIQPVVLPILDRSFTTNASNSGGLVRTSAPIAAPIATPVIITSPPLVVFSPRLPRNIYEAQLALARRGVSSGSLDGVMGYQTRMAVRAFQTKEHLAVTGEMDLATKERLRLIEPPEKMYVVTTNDLARLQPLGTNWLAKSLQKRLDYENIIELLAEMGQSHPNLIRSLNPSVNWTNVAAGTSIILPNVHPPPVRSRAALVRIRLTDKILQAFDSENQLLAHFPCSIARRIEKRPVGQLVVEGVALNPTYRFDPNNFPESAEARGIDHPLSIAPGPNNPVGAAWIRLDRPGYGIHGTPRPEDVGRTESHGCFRLANWNAQYLAQLVRVGTPVIVEP